MFWDGPAVLAEAGDQSLEIAQMYPLPMYVTAIGPSWSMGE